MIYVASPYSHPDPLTRKTRFLLAQDFVIHCMETMNVIPFSPIVYGHELAIKYDIPTDAQYWLVFNTNMMRRSECMFMLKIDGWNTSKGMELELKIAKLLQIPIVEFDANFNNLTELNAKFMVS